MTGITAADGRLGDEMPEIVPAGRRIIEHAGKFRMATEDRLRKYVMHKRMDEGSIRPMGWVVDIRLPGGTRPTLEPIEISGLHADGTDTGGPRSVAAGFGYCEHDFLQSAVRTWQVPERGA
jgi:hypothetical protein